MVSAREAATWIADKRDAIVDPEFCAVYLEYDAAFDWSPDDPRLDALADRAQRWIVNWPVRLDGRGGRIQIQGPAIARLVATSSAGSSPAWDRLTQIVRERRVPRPSATKSRPSAAAGQARAPQRTPELQEPD